MNFPAVIKRLAFVALAWPLVSVAQAQSSWPAKPIRIIVPFAPGGGTSNAARLLAQHFTETWGQPIVVDNRPGGNTVIGSEALAKSAPDGYSLLLMNTSHAINPSLMKSLPYDSTRDFSPISTIMTNYFMAIVHPSVKVASLKELVAQIRAERSGEWQYGSVGSTGVGRLAAESFAGLAGVKMINVPYKGTSQLLTDLLGGQVRFTIELPGLYIPHIKSGKLKALAVTGERRLKALPDVPTFAEAGMPDFDMRSWYGLMAPARTPRDVVAKLADEVARTMTLADTRERLAAIEAEPFTLPPQQFEAFLRAETEKFAKIIKAAQITVEP